jgi:hypothetical protein
MLCEKCSGKMNPALKCTVCGHSNAAADGHMDAEAGEKTPEQFQAAQERMYHTGKAIVFTIATLNIILSVISFFTDFDFISLIVQIALSIALYRGVRWVKYLFAAGSVISVILILYAFTSGNFDMPNVLIGFLIFCLIFSVFSAIFLFVSKSVSAFLYAQRNG